MAKEYLSPDAYKAFIDAYHDRYDYDNLSDEEKTEFDRKVDSVIGKKEEAESMESTDLHPKEQLRETLRNHYGYDDMSDERKESFDRILDDELNDRAQTSVDVPSEVVQSETDKFKNELRERYGYDDMSDEQKADFDKAMSKELGTDETDSDEGTDDPEPPARRLVLRR